MPINDARRRLREGILIIMKFEDIDEFACRERHEKPCDNCKTKHIVYSQADNGPEYYTNVYFKCSNCGDFVEFILPVN